MMRMMHSFDHSGEEASSRKRQRGEDDNDGNDDNADDKLKEQVSKLMRPDNEGKGDAEAHEDPPARERPAVSTKYDKLCLLCLLT